MYYYHDPIVKPQLQYSDTINSVRNQKNAVIASYKCCDCVAMVMDLYINE